MVVTAKQKQIYILITFEYHYKYVKIWTYPCDAISITLNEINCPNYCYYGNYTGLHIPRPFYRNTCSLGSTSKWPWMPRSSYGSSGVVGHDDFRTCVWLYEGEMFSCELILLAFPLKVAPAPTEALTMPNDNWRRCMRCAKAEEKRKKRQRQYENCDKLSCEWKQNEDLQIYLKKKWG